MRKYKFRFYKRLPEKYKDTVLKYFVNQYGELKEAVLDNKVIQVIITKGRRGNIIGWCAVYKSLGYFEQISDKDYCLGIFVHPKHRHRGIGGMLRRKAILWCLRRYKPVYFFEGGYKETFATKEGLQYI